MIQHQGVWLPDGEVHLRQWMDKSGEIVDGKGTYQIKKLRKAVSYCKQFNTAIDIGAHVGLWSMQLVKKFAHVHAFEPVAAHCECFERNVLDDATLYPYALGEVEQLVEIETAPTSSGDSRVQLLNGGLAVEMKRLDGFDIHDVDFMKLDCEGYELFALLGGEVTIRRDMPVIIVEQKPGRAQRFGLPERGAVSWLECLGYRLEAEMAGDFVMVPQ